MFKMLSTESLKSFQTFKWISKVSEIYLSNLSIYINEKNNHGNTIFHLASQLKEPKVLSYIISKCQNINEKNLDGETCLHLASKVGNTKNAKLLLDWGANVDSLTNRMETPLMYACRHMKNVELVKLLLRYNANMELINFEGEKALDISRNQSTYRTNLQQIMTILKTENISNEIIKLLHPIYRQL